MPHAARGEAGPGRVAWEDVPCPLCGARDEELVLTAPGGPGRTLYRLVRCRPCGFGYVNPRPDPDSIRQFYPEDYKPHRPRAVRGAGRWAGLRRRLQRLVLRG